MQRPQTGPQQWPASGYGPAPMPPRPQTGPMPQGNYGPGNYGPAGGWAPQPDYRPQGGYPGPGPGPGQPVPDGGRGRPRPTGGNPGQAPWEGGLPEPDPAFKYREPGPGMPGYRGYRDNRYGGDTR